MSFVWYDRTYDSKMIYHVLYKVWTLQFSDATDCMLKLVNLDNSPKPTVIVFKIASNQGSILETLHYCGPSSNLFISKYTDFVLVDSTHKTNIYNLSLVVITVVDILEI